MQLGLRAKLTMIMTGLVLLSTAVLSLVFSELLLQQVLHDTDKRANDSRAKRSIPRAMPWKTPKPKACARLPKIPRKSTIMWPTHSKSARG